MKLFSTLVLIAGLALTNIANAVQVSPTGLGQVLIFPYYTVNGKFNTYFSVVNTTNTVKAVKLRFREGKASNDVLDFNIFLSAYDTWTAGIVPSSSGGARLLTVDRSCTIPTVPVEGFEFLNYDYVGDAVNDNTLTRAREGYIEVIEMATYAANDPVSVGVTHDAVGVPRDCSVINTLSNTPPDAAALVAPLPPTGGLSGTVQLVAPGQGFNASTDPVALINFSSVQIYGRCCNRFPSLVDGNSLEAYTPTNSGNWTYTTWNRSIDAVSAALTKTSLVNEFMLEPNVNGATDWVVTFPTRNAYVTSSTATAPFTNPLSPVGSCVNITMDLYKRDRVQAPGEPILPSPLPPITLIDRKLCWESSVVTFNGHNPLASNNSVMAETGYPNGWGRITFANTFASKNGVTLTGLPVIGFAAQAFRASPTMQYVGTFHHRYNH